MSAFPSILMFGVLTLLSFVGAAILSKPWHRYVAFGCGAVEIAMMMALLFLALAPPSACPSP